MMASFLRSAAAALLCLVPLSHLALEAGEPDFFGKPLRHWIDGVSSADAKTRDEALRTLARIGPPAKEAAPLLKPLLKDASAVTRLDAAIALLAVEGNAKDARPVLAGDLAALTPIQRVQLTDTLRKAPPDGDLVELCFLLAKDPYLLSIGAEALLKLGEPAAAKFLDAHPGKDRGVAISMVPFMLTLRSGGGLLEKYLKDPDPSARLHAASGLAAIPKTRDAAVDVLVDLCKGDDRELAHRAVSTLTNVRPAPKKAEEWLVKALDNKDLKLRLAAAPSVLDLRPDDPAAIAAISAGVQDPANRGAAMNLILQRNLKIDALVPTFLAMLREAKQSSDAMFALCALAPYREKVAGDVADFVFTSKVPIQFFGPGLSLHGESLVGPLQKRLDGDDRAARIQAIGLVDILPAKSAAKLVPSLAALLKTDDAAAALTALERLGPAARPAMPEIFALLERPDADNWLQPVTRAVREIRPNAKALEPAYQSLSKTLVKDFTNPASADRRRILAAQMASMMPERRKEVTGLVEPILRERNFLGVETYDLLARLGPDAAPLVPAIVDLLQRSENSTEFGSKLCEKIGPAARPAAPILLERAKRGQNPQILLALCRALGSIDPEKRGEADAKLATVFADHLAKFPGGSEIGYFVVETGELCKRYGPSKELEPMLLTILRKVPRPEARALAAEPLVKLDPKHEAEVLKTLEGDSGFAALLNLRPDHPVAGQRLREYLTSPYSFQRRGGLVMASTVNREVAGLRPVIEALLKDDDAGVRSMAAVVLMRWNKTLDAVRVDEMLAAVRGSGCSGQAATMLDAIDALGPLARPLVPRLRELAAERLNPALTFRIEGILLRLE